MVRFGAYLKHRLDIEILDTYETHLVLGRPVPHEDGVVPPLDQWSRN